MLSVLVAVVIEFLVRCSLFPFCGDRREIRSHFGSSLFPFCGDRREIRFLGLLESLKDVLAGSGLGNPVFVRIAHLCKQRERCGWSFSVPSAASDLHMGSRAAEAAEAEGSVDVEVAGLGSPSAESVFGFDEPASEVDALLAAAYASQGDFPPAAVVDPGCSVSLGGPDSEDAPVADLMDSESQWWNQVRDNSTVPVQRAIADPLAGRKVDFDAVFRSANQAAMVDPDIRVLKQPWEDGVFGFIFGGKELVDFVYKGSCPTFLPGEDEMDAGAAAPSAKRFKAQPLEGSFSRVVRSRALVDWKQQRSAQLDIGLQTWLELVLRWGPCVLSSQVEVCSSRSEQLEVIGDTFKGKAPSTILKRARALMLLQDFLKEKELHVPMR